MVHKLNKVPFEEALNMTGWGKYNLLTFFLCSGVISAMVFELYSVSYVVPGSACELNTSSTQQGLVAGLPLVGVMLTSHLWGYLADLHGRRKMLILSMAIGFITGSLSAFSPNWIVLCLFKFLSSAAVSGASALSVALLGECTPERNRSMLLMLTTSAFLLCTGIMAVLSIPVLPLTFSYYIPILNIHFNSWRLLTLIFSLPCAVSCLGIICSTESPKYLLTMGEDKKALEVLKYIYEKNNRKSEGYMVESIVLDEENLTTTEKGFWKSIVAQTVPMLKPPMLKNTLLLAALFMMVFICVNPFVVWFPVMADAFISSVEDGATGLSLCEMIRLSKNVTESNIDSARPCSMNNSAMSMVLGISAILACLNVVAGLLLRCVGKRTFYLSIQMVSGTAALLMNVTPLWSVSAVLLLAAMSGTLNFGFLSSFTVDLFPTFVKAKAVCLMLMLGRASTIIGINALKYLLEENCEAAFYAFGVIALGAGFLGLLLPQDRKMHTRLEPDKERIEVQPAL